MRLYKTIVGNDFISSNFSSLIHFSFMNQLCLTSKFLVSHKHARMASATQHQDFHFTFFYNTLSSLLHQQQTKMLSTGAAARQTGQKPAFFGLAAFQFAFLSRQSDLIDRLNRIVETNLSCALL